MKILIAHDGSENAERILQDLPKAGLPERASVTLLRAAELPMPVYSSPTFAAIGEPMTMVQFDEFEHQTRAVLEKAAHDLRAVRERLLLHFPEWSIRHREVEGSPSTAILSEALDGQVDLIIVGSRGQAGLRRRFLGSVSQRVLSEARASVRIIHSDLIDTGGPQRILVGIDGSADADLAVASLLEREYPTSAEIHLVCVLEPGMGNVIDFLSLASHEIERDWAEHDKHWATKLLAGYHDKLASRFPNVVTLVAAGHPKSALLHYAKHIEASSILLGARGAANGFERFLLGSVSTAIAQHAHTTVEVVRRRK